MRALAALAGVLAGCGTHDLLGDAFGPDGRTIRQTIETFPPEQREAFALMEARCTKCHTLNEPFAARLAAGTWRSQVAKMARKPGALIPEADADRIAAFMEYFAAQRRAANPPGDPK